MGGPNTRRIRDKSARRKANARRARQGRITWSTPRAARKPRPVAPPREGAIADVLRALRKSIAGSKDNAS